MGFQTHRRALPVEDRSVRWPIARPEVEVGRHRTARRGHLWRNPETPRPLGPPPVRSASGARAEGTASDARDPAARLTSARFRAVHAPTTDFSRAACKPPLANQPDRAVAMQIAGRSLATRTWKGCVERVTADDCIPQNMVPVSGRNARSGMHARRLLACPFSSTFSQHAPERNAWNEYLLDPKTDRQMRFCNIHLERMRGTKVRSLLMRWSETQWLLVEAVTTYKNAWSEKSRWGHPSPGGDVWSENYLLGELCGAKRTGPFTERYQQSGFRYQDSDRPKPVNRDLRPDARNLKPPFQPDT
jgi:hypothetical protein